MTDVQAWLDQGRTLADQATEGPWEAIEDSNEWLADCPPTVESLVSAADETPIIDWGNGSRRADAEFIADARTRLPQALAALQAVHDLHQPVEFVGHSATWLRCTQGCPTWPCPTVEAIQAAIGDKP